MKVLNAEQMKNIDRQTIKEIGILGPVLMENAGIQIVKALKSKFPEPQRERIVIVTGRGNNGGDGLVVARHLFNQDCQPLVLLLGTEQEVKGDAALNLRIAQRIGIEILKITSAKVWDKHKTEVSKATLLVDAIFGTGLTKPVKGLYAKVIEDMNKSKAYTIAVDIPSGLSSDTYQIIGPCVKADLTVTLAAPKIAHVFPPAEDRVGELVIAEISVPRFLFEDDKLRLELVEKKDILPYFKKRMKDTHKGTYGHLFIVSGSFGKTGAAVMAGKAALKMGAGLVTIGTPQSCLPIVARPVVELMTEPLSETAEGTISVEALEKTIALLRDKDALLIGPGISTHRSTAEFVLSLLPQLKLPTVIDADALNILASKPEILKSLRKPIIITPHPGEFARLLRVSTRDVLERKLELVPEFSEKHGVYLVLKSYKTLISNPEGKVFINPTGNPGMATAGSGDVLSGMIASMIVQEKNLLEAILAAVYVHGLSGDVGAEKLGEKSLTAGNIINFLPRTIKQLESET
ncbi:MAG: NAD(P)H-hydrate dehydratase [Candidatus Aminicenantes bacterium]|nr:NAD(P)H-hydrate dehydratase [Candidatus Aminicenantes bacterium]